MHRRFAVLGFVLLGGLAIAIGVGFVQVMQSNRATHHYVTERVPAVLKLLKLDTDLYHAQLALVRATGAEPGDARQRHLETYTQNVDEAVERFNAVGDLAEAERARDMLATFQQSRTAWLEQASSLTHLLRNDASPDRAKSALASTITAFEAMQAPINRLETRFHDPLAKGTAIETHSRFLTTSLLVVVVSGMAISAALLLYYVRAIQRQQRELHDRDEQRSEEHQKRRFEARLNNALSMASNEKATLQLMSEVIDEIHPQGPGEVLLADASNAHLYQAATTDPANAGPGCPVATPSACPAVQRGHELTFERSDDFEVCPHLRGRPDGDCSATCVPISIMGQAVGVLHCTGENHQPPDPEQTEMLAMVASKSSERIGMLRAFEQSQNQATTDPLTGLANRRHIESEIHTFNREGVTYALAYADLDHFKQLNDTHGHETGDRALRQFSRVLQETIRPADYACRWGGEEFLIVLPRATAEQAQRVMQRVSVALDQTLQRADTPSFTVSVGISEADAEQPFETILAQADAALMRAKENGRARIELSAQDAEGDAVGAELDALFDDPSAADQATQPTEPTA
jgi:diguanylate cyclase (GGDEF)-like protein